MRSIEARAQRCAPGLPRHVIRTSWCRTLIWNTTRATIAICLKRCSMAAPTWSTARAFSVDRIACSFSGTTLGNRMLTLVSDMLCNLNLTDMETGMKGFRRDKLMALKLSADRFTFEPEITAKAARARWRIYEVPISYSGRTYAEGKKIGWRDAIAAIGAVLYYRFAD